MFTWPVSVNIIFLTLKLSDKSLNTDTSVFVSWLRALFWLWILWNCQGSNIGRPSLGGGGGASGCGKWKLGGKIIWKVEIRGKIISKVEIRGYKIVESGN